MSSFSHRAKLQVGGQFRRWFTNDSFTMRIFDAINGMMLDMLAAIASKDYEDRRRPQAQGIAKAKPKAATRDAGRMKCGT